MARIVVMMIVAWGSGDNGGVGCGVGGDDDVSGDDGSVAGGGIAGVVLEVMLERVVVVWVALMVVVMEYSLSTATRGWMEWYSRKICLSNS